MFFAGVVFHLLGLQGEFTNLPQLPISYHNEARGGGIP